MVIALGACGSDDDDADEAANAPDASTTTADDMASTTTSADTSDDPGVDNTTPSQGIVELMASLTGTAEVGHDGDSDGSGEATVRVDVNNREICFTITTTNLDDATAAHIHKAPEGENGDIVVTLEPPKDDKAEGCARDVAMPLATTIAGNPSGYYVNVHTSAQPEGAIRGQLAAKS